MGQYNWAIKLLEQQTMQKDEKITPQCRASCLKAITLLKKYDNPKKNHTKLTKFNRTVNRYKKVQEYDTIQNKEIGERLTQLRNARDSITRDINDGLFGTEDLKIQQEVLDNIDDEIDKLTKHQEHRWFK